MDILIKVLQFLLSLSILVLFHEFGHFLFAKLFRTRVEKFYMFFNPWFSLFKFKKGETEYGMGWLPIGGYVKIAGMIDESMDTEQMKKPAQSWEFRAKPAWQRLLIMLGGVLVNVILAFAIYIMVLYTWGESYLPAQNVTYGVTCDSVFLKMGIQNGDIILALDDKPVEDFFQVVPDMLLNNSKTIQIKRDSALLTLDIPKTLLPDLLAVSSKRIKAKPLLMPRMPLHNVEINGFADYSVAYDAGVRAGDRLLAINGTPFYFQDEFTALLEANKNKQIETEVLRGTDTLRYAFTLGSDAMLGVMLNPERTNWEFATRQYSFLEAIPAGINRGMETISSYLKQIRLLFSPQVEAYKSVGGMLSIGNIFPGVWDWQIFWELTAFISIMLAIVNILPIPALDGGHVLFLLFEVITRRRPSEKFLEYAQVTGMMLLLGLFILSNVNDVMRFFG